MSPFSVMPLSAGFRFAGLAVIAAIFLLCAPRTVWAAEVSQGRCIQFDAGQGLMVVEEFDTNFTPEHRYGMATGIITTFDISRARIGIEPRPDDIVRTAYVMDGEKRIAVRVMNVTRQEGMR